MTGFHVPLMLDVARAGNFTYSIASFPSRPKMLSFTEYANRVLDRFDVLVNDGIATAERANKGIVTPFPMIDESVYAVEYHK
eukprot:CAMPEP_0179033810 /NCGR_PEP_ID=MMETSP0796-20121207/12290_1 /TAXON_ID=73915 /ORGANISM="Pyrodinium bahamense, Strain pbaha01" /LENGTH=81 /DNA_ID=CAMNT_0020730069 /DNA_START=11 /DNA_END=253 /DNA_ORIENTATION=-